VNAAVLDDAEELGVDATVHGDHFTAMIVDQIRRRELRDCAE